jgi:alpha-tubulin suppressor-like RCC1 family protein
MQSPTYSNRHGLIAALLVTVALGLACRDSPVSPQPRIATSLPALTIAAITDDVQLLRAILAQLEAGGALTTGQANALTSKIDAAARRIQSGNERAGGNVFEAFIQQVNAFVNARVLTTRQAQPLLDAVLSSLGDGVARRPLAAGYRFTCALTNIGEAQCWGANDYGQLGDGTTQTRLAPVAVKSGLSFRQIAGGASHACAVTGEGVAYCWGAGGAGQLGDGTTADRSVPAPVTTDLRFTQLTTGVSHTCGLTRTGTVYCWGWNIAGALGDGGWADRVIPTPVVGGLSFTEIRGGGWHTCAIAASAGLYCWGWNNFGQLGNGSTATRNLPILIAGGTRFSQIAAYAYHTCALTPDGRAYCWGSIENGGLTPTVVPGGVTFATLSEGGVRGTHMCAVSTAGPTFCWGVNNFGQVGDGTNTPRPVPTLIAGTYAFAQLSGGGEHTCGRTAAGQIYCWGGNFVGQLGDGTTTSRNVPTPIATAGR